MKLKKKSAVICDLIFLIIYTMKWFQEIIENWKSVCVENIKKMKYD
jgi:hypothetical protein